MQPPFDQVAFSVADGYAIVALSDIVCCEAQGSYTCLHLKGGEQLLLSKGLKTLEEHLPSDHFIRVHHHTIAGKLHIKKVLKNSGLELLMSNGEKLPVAARRKAALLGSLTVF